MRESRKHEAVRKCLIEGYVVMRKGKMRRNDTA